MFDMNNPSSWSSMFARLKSQMGIVGKSISELGDTAFQAHVEKTIHNASRQYRSLTGARYVSPNSERLYNEDKLRLEHTEKDIENMLVARPLAYDPDLFTQWHSDNKCAILLRAQSHRSTPLCTNGQNIFHVLANQSSQYWLNEWYKNQSCMPQHVVAHWLNDLSDQNQTPLQMFWAELCGGLRLHAQCGGPLSFKAFQDLNAITTATIVVLQNDWAILEDQSPKSIAQYWNAIKNENDVQLLCPTLFEEIQAVITHKNITDVLGEQNLPKSVRKI